MINIALNLLFFTVIVFIGFIFYLIVDYITYKIYFKKYFKNEVNKYKISLIELAINKEEIIFIEMRLNELYKELNNLNQK